MEKGFRVPLKFGGYKYFYGDNAEIEANEYELEMKRKEAEEKERQKKELEERKKVDAERKAKEEKRKSMLDAIQSSIDLVNQEVAKLEKETGEKLEYVTVNGKLEVKPYGYIGTFTSIPVIGLSKLDTHDNWWNQLYKELRGY